MNPTPLSLPSPTPLELLAPAKNVEFGLEALRHGADAVYIGGPVFGARAQAGNPIADIERLAREAHCYHAHVFAAVNTLLKDEELEPARRVLWQLYEAGVDAVILQDMGLLELDLPPIQLHASTQTDIRSVEKARFLSGVGFSQLVLARELNLIEIRRIAAALPDCRLEFFVHGALCVSYSGQCYISHAHTGRSANRGECSQACRLPYDLTDPAGRVIVQEKHLLSLKDNDQSANLLALAEAGIASFKIEGRLKDLSYVKNITAHYRQLLDALLETYPDRFCRASAGRCTYTFTPQPEKTFNRGNTDYFVQHRQSDIAAFETPAFSGTPIGRVCQIRAGHSFDLEPATPDLALHNGDGLSWFDAEQELQGMRVNTAEKHGHLWRCAPHVMPEDLRVETPLYRNRDQSFERLLEKPSAERRIPVRLHFEETPQGFALTLTDENGIRAAALLPHAGEAAKDKERAETSLRENLLKLGNTRYRPALPENVDEALTLTLAKIPFGSSEQFPTVRAEAVVALDFTGSALRQAQGERDYSEFPFLPASLINRLRREAVAALDDARAAAYSRPARKMPDTPPPTYPESALSYLGNVYNQRARDFYQRHGVRVIADAFEMNQEPGEVALMTTRHCLRYSFNLCPREVKGLRPDPLILLHGKEKLTLTFDCKKCAMQVRGKLKKQRVIPVRSVL